MNLPCIDCITLSICKARYSIQPKRHKYDYNDSFELFDRRHKVMARCSLLSDYFHDQKRAGFMKVSVDEFHGLFAGVTRYE